GSNSYGQAININGKVAGYSDSVDGTYFAFTFDVGIHDLGLVGGTNVKAINDAGQITGTQLGKAFIYNSGKVTELPTLGGSSSAGNGINRFGNVVGTSSTAD